MNSPHLQSGSKFKIPHVSCFNDAERWSKDVSEDITKSIADASGATGTISGVFKKTDGTSDGSSSNEVTVQGIGADNKIVAADTTAFESTIGKVGVTTIGDAPGVTNTGAGTASGSASGSINTTASANANSSQFVSSFAQAY